MYDSQAKSTGSIDFLQSQQNTEADSMSVQSKKLYEEVFHVVSPSDPHENSNTFPAEEKKIHQEAEKEAHKDYLKEAAKEEEKSTQKLETLSEAASFVLFKAESSAPLDFFPDEIIIDTNKASIIHRQFFATERIHSVMIKDVSDVFIDTSLFWTKLTIVDIGFTENEVSIEYLKSKDAIRARRIIQGLVIAQQQGIDFTKLKQEMSPEEIVEKIERLGRARIPDDPVEVSTNEQTATT